MKTQSFRFRGGVVRIAAWHGRADVASLAVRGPGRARVRRCRAPARSGARGRLPGSRHERARARGHPPARRRRLRGARPAARPRRTTSRPARDVGAGPGAPAAASATRCSPPTRPRSTTSGTSTATGSARRARDAELAPAGEPHGVAPTTSDWSATPLRASRGRRLRATPRGRGPTRRDAGSAPRSLTDGLRWLRRRGAARAYVNTQSDNERALRAVRAGRVPAVARRPVRARTNAVSRVRVARAPGRARARSRRAAARHSHDAAPRPPPTPQFSPARPATGVGEPRRRRPAAARRPGRRCSRENEAGRRCASASTRRSRRATAFDRTVERRAARQPHRPDVIPSTCDSSTATSRARCSWPSGSRVRRREPALDDPRARRLSARGRAAHRRDASRRSSPGSSSPIRPRPVARPVRLAIDLERRRAPPVLDADGRPDRKVVAELAPGGRLDDVATLLDDAGSMPLTVQVGPETLESWNALAQSDARLAPGLGRVETAVAAPDDRSSSPRRTSRSTSPRSRRPGSGRSSPTQLRTGAQVLEQLDAACRPARGRRSSIPSTTRARRACATCSSTGSRSRAPSVANVSPARHA